MKDLMLTGNYGLLIKNGDVVIGRSNQQHQETLLLTQPGSFLEAPDVGVGLENFLNDTDVDGLTKKVRSEFVKDGQQVNAVGYEATTGNLTYDANYPN